jgi:hypothetical protein
MESDERKLEDIIRGQAALGDGPAPAVLQVVLYQFLAADIVHRELDKHRWVGRVVWPENDVNYFPTPQAVLGTFFEDS